jgi:hypothetical protein
LFGSRENVVPRNRLYAPRINIVDALLDLGFPLRAKVESVETRGDRVHEFGAFARG